MPRCSLGVNSDVPPETLQFCPRHFSSDKSEHEAQVLADAAISSVETWSLASQLSISQYCTDVRIRSKLFHIVVQGLSETLCH